MSETLTDAELDEMLWDEKWTHATSRVQAILALWEIVGTPYALEWLLAEYGVTAERVLRSVQRLSILQVTAENLHEQAMYAERHG